jgi:hypothetical protein
LSLQGGGGFFFALPQNVDPYAALSRHPRALKRLGKLSLGAV